MAERAAPKLLGSEQRRQVVRLEAEHANLRAALGWLTERGEAEPALRLAGDLFLFWFLRGHLREGTAWLEQALARAERTNRPTLVGALRCRHADVGLRRFLAGGGHREPGTRARGRARFEFGSATALYLLFLATEMQGRREEAIALGEQAVAHLRHAGVRAWLAYALGDVGLRLAEAGDRERGAAWVEEGLALHRELGNKQGLGNKLSDLGRVSHEAGDAPAAARHYAESLRCLSEAGDAWYPASPVEGLAAVALDAGQPERAARLLGSAAALRSGAEVPFGSPSGAAWNGRRRPRALRSGRRPMRARPPPAGRCPCMR